MPEFERSAATSRSLAAAALAFLAAVFSTAGQAADLRPLHDPAGIEKLFPARAKLRMLNVWATWCLPCVAEMPDLVAIDAAFGTELAIVGVTLDDAIPDASQKRAADFLDRQKVVFPNAWYSGNVDALGERLRFSGEIPITIVYDHRGRELWRHQGRIDRKTTIARLRALLKEK